MAFRRITSQIELAISASQIGFYTSPHDLALLQTQLPQTLVPENNFKLSVMLILQQELAKVLSRESPNITQLLV